MSILAGAMKLVRKFGGCGGRVFHSKIAQQCHGVNDQAMMVGEPKPENYVKQIEPDAIRSHGKS